MKILLFISALFIISCNSKENDETFNGQKKEQREISIQEKIHLVKNERTFEETQDSLRQLLLMSKPNENLKSSLLRELYIRGLVDQVNDKIIFDLPFNLHSFGCGAPDCYSTDITFKIPASEPIEFPKKINFNLSESGCVDEEIFLSGVFELTEKSTDYVNYYSKKLKSNLIIKTGTELYYYPHQTPKSVKVETIDELFETFEFEKENVIVPYRSTVMITNEYQLLLMHSKNE